MQMFGHMAVPGHNMTIKKHIYIIGGNSKQKIHLCIDYHKLKTIIIRVIFLLPKIFHLNSNLKKCHFFDTSVLFLSPVLSARGISGNPPKIEKVRAWPIPTNTKSCIPFRNCLLSSKIHSQIAKMAYFVYELVG